MALRRPAGPVQRRGRAWFAVTRLERHVHPYRHNWAEFTQQGSGQAVLRSLMRRYRASTSSTCEPSAARASLTAAGGGAVEVRDEHVVAEPDAARARFDAREVDVADRQLAERRRASPAPRRRRPRRRSSSSPAPRAPAARPRARARRSGWRCPGGPRRRPRSARSRTARRAASRGRRSCRRRRAVPPRPRSRARSRAPRPAAARAGSARTAIACGWETTRRTPPGSSRVAAIRQWWMGCTTSAPIRTSSASSTSVSSVTATPPSSAFSIGTTARSAAPSWTAITAS